MHQPDMFEQTDQASEEQATEEIVAPEPIAETEPIDLAAAVPFGAAGANFLRNLTQHGVFLGVVVIVIAILRIFGPE